MLEELLRIKYKTNKLTFEYDRPPLEPFPRHFIQRENSR